MYRLTQLDTASDRPSLPRLFPFAHHLIIEMCKALATSKTKQSNFLEIYFFF